MNRSFQSILAAHLSGFVKMKRNMGYDYFTEKRILHRIDKLIFDEGLETVSLPKSIAHKWCARTKEEGDRTIYGRVIVYIHFAAYLKDMGYDAYIPKRPKHPLYSNFVPYIFSYDEIQRLFSGTDKLQTTFYDKTSAVFSIPLMVRILYGTGIRLNEACSLLNKDVDMNSQTFIIRDSKSRKERIIPISDSLTECCRHYLQNRKRLNINKGKDDPFLVSLRGRKLYNSVAYKWFRKCLESAGIEFSGSGKGPRVHDLRHTFAVHSMAAMARAGVDLYVSLPILSVYMGHETLRSTEEYVRLTSELFPELLKDLELNSLNVFPKLTNYEAD